MEKIYYGEETKKALRNFPFSVYKVHKEFLMALVQIKKAAATANFLAGKISRDVKIAIIKACEEILEGKLKGQFPLKAVQGGAGTSTNMNVNEVIANRATEILQKQGRKTIVHPNDHVNCSQSTNDANPSAIKIAAFALIQDLAKALGELINAFESKAKEFKNIPKLARTHLQDAIPTTLGAEFLAYADSIKGHKKNLEQVIVYTQILNLGGTAIGNSMNAGQKYVSVVYKELNKNLKGKFKPAENLMSKTGSQGDFLIISQAVTAALADISKIANDLKLLSSGPRGGFGEITLPELQKGSSIMPGKVNPVMPELVNQLYFIVSGNNLTIEHCVQAAQLELGVMFPAIADRLLQSIKLSTEVLNQFTKTCIQRIRANKTRCKQLLDASTAYATLLVPKLGYDAVSDAVKESIKSNKGFKEIILEKKLLTNKEFEALTKAKI